jgi:hypothetical protein
MGRRVFDFERQAGDLLGREEQPSLKALDNLITDGAAEATRVEAELLRLQRERARALEMADTDHRESRRVVQLAEREQELLAHFEDVQSAIHRVMTRRAQVLRAFLADH